MSSLVYFEIFAARKHLAAILKGTRKGLFARVHANVIDELVLGLEGLSVSVALLPHARVIRALGPADVVDGNVRHDLLHRHKLLEARRAVFELVLRLGREQRFRVNAWLATWRHAIGVARAQRLQRQRRLQVVLLLLVLLVLLVRAVLVLVLVLVQVARGRRRGVIIEARGRARCARDVMILVAVRKVGGRVARRARVVLLLGGHGRLRGGQLRLLLLLLFRRQLDPQARVRAERLALARARVARRALLLIVLLLIVLLLLGLRLLLVEQLQVALLLLLMVAATC